ncbi:glutathione S-transferase 1-like [Uranotaenia lowii]|uniref:glutathione S-transferase 1-like n=1 Tax=Uranotaenia lowii TaxID=190385 RepID=UPI00247AA7FD|nr:glutathione S-transferase 1-like [Uranotaenia lowii]
MDLYYHPISPPCWSVILLAKQLDLPINLKKVDMFAGEHLKEDFLKLNPQHSVPTLVDGEFTLSESHAILTYLADAHSGSDEHPLYPRDKKVRAQIHHRLSFDLDTLYRRFYAFGTPIWTTKTEPSEENRTKLNEALGFLSAYLSRGRFAVGDSITIADIPLAVSVFCMEMLKFDLSPYPKVQEWYAACKQELVGMKSEFMDNALEEFKKFLEAPKQH